MSSRNPDWTPLLQRTSFFSDFSEDELARVLDRLTLVSLPKDVVLYHRGDAGHALYIVQSGRLRIVQNEGDSEKTVAYLSRGECLGEMCLLNGEPRPHTAVVDSTVELLVLERKDFEILLRDQPSMAVHISRELSYRLLEMVGAADVKKAPTSKIFSLVSRLSLENVVVFTVNLAVSLCEQTRRKVLVLDILDHDQGCFARSLGLSPVRVAENSLTRDDLQSSSVIQRLTVHHASGLEVVSLPAPLMEGKFLNSLIPFLTQLRKNYDLILLVLPLRDSPMAQAAAEESDRTIWLGNGDEPTTGVFDSSRLLRVELTEGLRPTGFPHTVRVPWKPSLGALSADGRAGFLNDAPLTQRQIARLARQLSGLQIGFALGSGAAFGYTAIGMLRVMERHGIYPDILSGTSMGALLGSFYAAGKSPDELEQIALTITKRKLLSLADFTLPWQGIIIGQNVLKFLKSVIGDVRFEDLLLPFTCVATDIVTGEEVILKQGKVAEAVRASLSLPFFFQPYYYNDRFLVDGGLVNPVPTSLIASMGADILLSVNLTSKPSQKKLAGRRTNWRQQSRALWKGPNIVEVLAKTMYTMQYEIAQARAEIAHVVLAPDLSNFTWSEFYRAADLIKLGEETLEAYLPKIKSYLPFFADHCKVPLRTHPSSGHF